MKPQQAWPALLPDDNEISQLVETLHEIGQRLELLTGGEVDTVASRGGRMVMLRRAQEHMRRSAADKQAAVLDALPAHIAVIDPLGRLLMVNAAWRHFGRANHLLAPGGEVGFNYLDICDAAAGEHTAEAAPAAVGIRAVLGGALPSFSIEYPCHGPQEQRWFQMTVTPLGTDPPQGAVVMHVNITVHRQTQERIAYLNRVYAMLSGINTLIVRVRERTELFREACRIAVEVGGFRMALIARVDPATQQVALLASAGIADALLRDMAAMLASSETGPRTMIARAVAQQRAIVSNDSPVDPQVLLGPRYVEAGVCSMAVLPLLLRGEAIGVLALYAGEREFFHAEELQLLNELSGDIAFALDHIGQQEQLDYLARYDELTGLANRRLFMERLAEQMRGAAGSGTQMALFLVDLARFKNINDNLGQVLGDLLLRQVAEWLVRHSGDASLLTRLGADHFAVLLPQVRPGGDVQRLLELTLTAFMAHPFRLDNAVYRMALKVGVALYPADASDAQTLFKSAEAALKQAKSSGDRYLFFNAGMSEQRGITLTLENQLRQALDRQEFVLHYQPKVNLASGEVCGAEALIRWNDPRSGLVPPGRFIPVLEETGMIYEVGRWALQQAIKDYLRWRQAGLAAVRIAVNVSPLQLRHGGFVSEIERATAGDASAAAGLELEITESLIMEDVRHSIDSLQAIRAMGITVAIDDFGTGFSSLSHLAKLPVDTLKIDRSFVVDMSESPQGLALVSTIINLARPLRLKVVAEGVETAEQARLLRGLGCDEMQGYLFSKPLPAELFETCYLRVTPDRSGPGSSP